MLPDGGSERVHHCAVEMRKRQREFPREGIVVPANWVQVSMGSGELPGTVACKG